MEYQRFEILICSLEGDRFEAQVLEAPFQDAARGEFPRPLPIETIERLQAYAEDKLEESEEESGDPRLLPYDAGQRLYEALFNGEIGELFDKSRAALANQDDVGLRLRLRFRLDDREVSYLAALPWELLVDPKTNEHLLLDLKTPIVRDLAHPHSRKGTLATPPPLRILTVAAEPRDQIPVDLRDEVERMERVLAALIEDGEVEIHSLWDPSPEELRDFLRETPVHVVHYLGHAGYHSPTGFGALLFADAQGLTEQVDGEMLAAIFKSMSSVRLVVLNACKTARHAGLEGAPLYYGTASALIARTGMPAVVAHQYSIEDSSATNFSEIFYKRLAAGDPVDTAITEARLQLWMRSPEWGSPVLFLSAESGEIFDLRAEAPTHGAAPHVAKKVRAEPLHLGVRSRVGWAQDMEEQADHTLDLTEHFQEGHDRYIRDPKDWTAHVFPRLRTFLLEHAGEDRPLLLDFAAHASIAFAAGWVLEAKSGLDVRVRQRTPGELVLDWHPSQGPVPDKPLWLDQPDLEIDSTGADVALGMSVSQATVAEQAKDYVERKGLPVRRVVDAVIAPEPGPRSVEGGAHALRLAQAILPRLRQRHPAEREGQVHLFCAAPNALMFYLGQLSPSLGWMTLYEYPFKAKGSYGRYQPSIELPPPEERKTVPEGW